MTHFRKLPCKLPGGLKCQESSGVQETNVLLRSRTDVGRSLAQLLKLQLKSFSLTHYLPAQCKREEVAKAKQVPDEERFIGESPCWIASKEKESTEAPLEGVCSSWAAWMVTDFHRTLITCPNQLDHQFDRSLTGSLDHFSSLSPSLPFPSLLLSSPLLSSPSFVTALLTLAACFFFVSTISSDSLSTWIFGGLREGVRESNEW